MNAKYLICYCMDEEIVAPDGSVYVGVATHSSGCPLHGETIEPARYA